MLTDSTVIKIRVHELHAVVADSLVSLLSATLWSPPSPRRLLPPTR
ncbi:hypothetical protein LINPERPRIM_LOCUS41125, partial [Linum perenne]